MNRKIVLIGLIAFLLFSGTGSVASALSNPEDNSKYLYLFDPWVDGLEASINFAIYTPSTNMHWDWGDDTESDGFSGIHTYSKSGTYTVTVTLVTKYKGEITKKVEVTVDSTKAAEDLEEKNNLHRLTLFSPEVTGLNVTINGVVVAPVERIEWDWGDGQKSVSWFAATHTYLHYGTYTVKVTTYDKKGRATIKELDVTLSPTPTPDPTPNPKNQKSIVSGVLEVSDSIRNIGTVDTSKIQNSLYCDSNTVIWKIVPSFTQSTDFPYFLENLQFYAKLENGKLSLLIDGDKAQALRGMIPSLEYPENMALSPEGDFDHFCYPYSQKKTLLYRILEQAFDELKSSSVIALSSSLNGNPAYASSFTDKVFIFGYYLSASEYDYNFRCFHNWPFGDGNDECKYHRGSYCCEYSDGTVEVTFDFDIQSPRCYYVWGQVYNDNSEETAYYYNGNRWLHQKGWARPHNNVKYGYDSFPSQIKLWARKTWSTVDVMTWMAIDANSVSVTGHVDGKGATTVDRSEKPDVLMPINLQKTSLSWLPSQEYPTPSPTVEPPISVGPAVEACEQYAQLFSPDYWKKEAEEKREAYLKDYTDPLCLTLETMKSIVTSAVGGDLSEAVGVLKGLKFASTQDKLINMQTTTWQLDYYATNWGKEMPTLSQDFLTLADAIEAGKKPEEEIGVVERKLNLYKQTLVIYNLPEKDVVLSLIESAEHFTNALKINYGMEAQTIPTTKEPVPTVTPPGFEVIFAIAGLLAVAYDALRRKK